MKIGRKVLNARGLDCPLPIIKAKKAMQRMSAGQVLHVVATDPGSAVNFTAFARHRGVELIESTQNGGEYHFVLKKR